MDVIVDNFYNVLVFLQEITVKSPRVDAAPMSLHTDKRARGWFRHRFSHHLDPFATPLVAKQQDHPGCTGVLSDVVIWLQNI